MIKFILILFFLTLSASQKDFLNGIICSYEQPNQRSNECIFDCIQIIYVRQFCTTCPTGSRLNDLQLNQTDRLSSLAPHNWINYDASSKGFKSLGKDSMTADCSGCQDQYRNRGEAERYIPSVELNRIFECTNNFRKDSKNTGCSVKEMSSLYAKISGHFDKSNEWCINALGIDEHRNKYLRMAINTGKARQVSKVNFGGGLFAEIKDREGALGDFSEDSEDSEDSTTTITPTERNEEDRPKTVTEDTPIQTTTLEIETTTLDEKLITEATTTSSSTMSITLATSTEATNSTTVKSKKKKKAEPHHFPNSVTVIFTVIGILLLVLMISALILSIYMNRRKRLQPRSDSCTYVFDTSSRD